MVVVWKACSVHSHACLCWNLSGCFGAYAGHALQGATAPGSRRHHRVAVHVSHVVPCCADAVITVSHAADTCAHCGSIVCPIIVVLVVQDCSAGCRHYACLASIYLQTGFVLPSWYHDGSWAPWPCHTSTPPFYPLSASPAQMF